MTDSILVSLIKRLLGPDIDIALLIFDGGITISCLPTASVLFTRHKPSFIIIMVKISLRRFDYSPIIISCATQSRDKFDAMPYFSAIR